MADTSDDPETLAAKHAPFVLGPGSYELADLTALGEKAVKAKPEERDAIVAQGLAEINQSPWRPDDTGLLPGHTFVDSEAVIAEGSEQPVAGSKKGETEIVGRVTAAERIQVFDPRTASADADAVSAAPGAVESVPSTAAAAGLTQPKGGQSDAGADKGD